MEFPTKKCLVRWPNYSSSVAFAVEALRFDGELVDITLACQGHTIRAHKLVLAACSHYFRQILKEHPCDHPTVVLDGIQWNDLLSILHFMYNGQVLVEEEAICSLLTAANSLAVIGLGYVATAIVHSKLKEECDAKEQDLDEDCVGDEKDASLENSSKIVSATKGISNPLKTLEGKDGFHTSKNEDEPPEKKPKSHKSSKLLIPSRSQSTLELAKVTDGLDNLEPSFEENCINFRDLNLFSKVKEFSETRNDVQLKSMFCKEDALPEEALGRDASPSMNGDGLPKCSNGNYFFYMDDSQEALSPDNGDMDLGPAPLPMNHPAVLASSSAAAALVLAAASGTPLGSVDPVSAVNYAAFVAAREMLPSYNIETTGSPNNNPWLSSTKESSRSPSPSNAAGFLHFPGMSQQEIQATLEQYQRKLAFHEPRPCPTCKRMYRDAATLRTHIAIMHSEGKDPFTCACGSSFRTKYEMYQHRKSGHR